MLQLTIDSLVSDYDILGLPKDLEQDSNVFEDG